MTLEIAFLDVGNADSIVVLTPEQYALIVDVPEYRYLYKWLDDKAIKHIESIYITHGHRDHLPSLTQLVNFLKRWIKNDRRTLGTLYLPIDVLRPYCSEAVYKGSKGKQKLDKDKTALEKLLSWRKEKKFRVLRSEKSNPYSNGLLSVHVLHPDALYVEEFYKNNPTRLNDLSLVLRLDYGNFRLLLPADIEQDGLQDLLHQCNNDNELQCHVLKVPHHGAWQEHSQDTKRLFTQANPELAVLSVGSKNRYKHVKPELFQALLQLQQTHRLQRFICTEVTRTCIHTAQERKKKKNAGLPSRQSCAGDIIIQVDQSGTWEFQGQSTHDTYVQNVRMAACRGRADLTSDRTVKNEETP